MSKVEDWRDYLAKMRRTKGAVSLGPVVCLCALQEHDKGGSVDIIVMKRRNSERRVALAVEVGTAVALRRSKSSRSNVKLVSPLPYLSLMRFPLYICTIVLGAGAQHY